jgi:hypothetical protein
MDESDKNLEMLRNKLEELYLRVRNGEACEEDAIKLSMVIDLLLVDKMKDLGKGKHPDSPDA